VVAFGERYHYPVRLIIDKALTQLPQTAATGPLREDARALVEALTVTQLAHASDEAFAPDQMIGAAARCPHIVRQDTVRDALAWAARRVAVASDAPTTSTEALRGALRHALAHRRTAPRRHAVNGLLSAIWAEVASLIATKHRRPPLTVRYAVGRAPLQLARPGLRAALRRSRTRFGPPV